MELVFIHHPALLICWAVSLIAAILVLFLPKLRNAAILVSAAAGAVTVLLGFYYAIPTSELLLMLLCPAAVGCAGGLRGGRS